MSEKKDSCFPGHPEIKIPSNPKYVLLKSALDLMYPLVFGAVLPGYTFETCWRLRKRMTAVAGLLESMAFG